MYLYVTLSKAEKLVQITTPLDTIFNIDFDSSYNVADILVVGGGGGTSSRDIRGGSSGGTMSYLEDFSSFSDNNCYILGPNSSYQPISSGSILGDRVISYTGVRPQNTAGSAGNGIGFSVPSLGRGGCGGGASYITSSYTRGAQGGGATGDGADWDEETVENGVSEENPNTLVAGSGGSTTVAGGSGGDNGGFDTAIPLFALGGTGKGGRTIATRAVPCGGGGGGGYGDGGTGAWGNHINGGGSSTDGGYGAGGGGGGGDYGISGGYPGSDGGQGIVVIRYH